jgi:hypothetical protein
MWSGSSGTICESNTFIDCERSIAFGLGPQTGFAHSHVGGIIRNNFIYRTITTHADAGISVWDSPGTEVLHNTVIQNGTYPNAIEYRFAGSSGVVIENNLTDGAIAQRDGASATLAGNLTTATPSFFVNASAADLHLVSTATAAIDKGVNVIDCLLDWDGQTRPIGPKRDIGADEFSAAVGWPFYAVAPCRLVDTRNAAGPLGGPALSAGSRRSFTLAGHCGIPADAQALSLNVTVTGSTAAGDLQLFAGGTTAPGTPTINYRAGETRANNAVARLGSSGDLAVQCDQGIGVVHLVLDVDGYFR